MWTKKKTKWSKQTIKPDCITQTFVVCLNRIKVILSELSVWLSYSEPEEKMYEEQIAVLNDYRGKKVQIQCHHSVIQSKCLVSACFLTRDNDVR